MQDQYPLDFNLRDLLRFLLQYEDVARLPLFLTDPATTTDQHISTTTLRSILCFLLNHPASDIMLTTYLHFEGDPLPSIDLPLKPIELIGC